MELLLTKETRQILGQRMYQSMGFLQMGIEELEQTMHELCMENPILEESPVSKDKSINRNNYGRIRTQSGQDKDLPIPEKVYYTLKMSLSEQLQLLPRSPEMDFALNLLLVNLDDKGFLPERIEETREWKQRPKVFSDALSILQGLDPAGVGARNVSECLCIQLNRMGLRDTIAYAICERYFQHLLRNHINHIAKALGVEESEIVKAKTVIASLNPVPANGYDDGKYTIWATPDIEISFENGIPMVVKLDSYVPEYSINKYYEELGKSNDLSEEDKTYFREKISQAKWVLNCLEWRKETIVACAEVMAREQQEFFETGHNIQPCSMNAVADELGVHPSTVSRTVKDKFVACQWGVFPMSYFFTHEIGSSTVNTIVEVIKQIVQEEDPKHPLSDNALCKALAERGIEIARRTVAKYRDEAGIPSATGRKSR